MFSLAEIMLVDRETLLSLQILHSEAHPNSHSGEQKNCSNTGTKEGLSVYGLVNSFASTPQGRLRLRQIFLRPTLDMETITERQETIRLFLRPENSEKNNMIAVILRRISNMTKITAHLRKGVDSPPVKQSFTRGV